MFDFRICRFAVACSFITNHYVHVALTNLPNNLRTSVDDVALYRDDTDQVNIHKISSGHRLFEIVQEKGLDGTEKGGHGLFARNRRIEGSYIFYFIL